MSHPTDTRSRRLRDQGASAGQAPEPLPRHPPWIRMKLPGGKAYFDMRARVHGQGLHTVCESASCPNIGECWSRGSLTLMILGGICTRSCRFCDVPTGRPLPPDPDEPERVAHMLANLDLRHTVITCVNRDDLPDGGAAHWAATIRAVRARCPNLAIEALTGDFAGNLADLDMVLQAGPDIFAHNLETVPRLAREVRVQASTPRSYAVLAHAVQRGALTKTGLMLGLGETSDEVLTVMREVRALGVQILTLGQYLRPSRQHLAVARHVPPQEFAELKQTALAMGFSLVESGPLVRSSYHAEGAMALVRSRRPERTTGLE